MNISSPDDRTARARIRVEALRLFTDHGPDVVTVRDVAAAAGVSPALVMRHYKTKEGLRAAVDAHVAAVYESLLGGIAAPGDSDPFAADAVLSMTELLVQQLPPDSPIPAYLGRMLLHGGPAATALFERLYTASVETLEAMGRAGHADPGEDPAVRAAFLLVNDLAVILLRARLGEVLGVDPLSRDGIRRWAGEVLTVYRTGLRGVPGAQPPARRSPRRARDE
ncbi:TetR/AcrR family transcriptional regulator [Nocardia wallacei]|uniref:TetR/AcrR family transcriptional regulator n=1 Tax=Nocardia wallacei TaxID=480035 RepID=UPI002456D34F|nr:TetR/AcrR family transcriptional regulator [Nocardia wallacei]